MHGYIYLGIHVSLICGISQIEILHKLGSSRMLHFQKKCPDPPNLLDEGKNMDLFIFPVNDVADQPLAVIFSTSTVVRPKLKINFMSFFFKKINVGIW